MADRHSLRRYLMFQALIKRVRDPERSVDRILRQHEDWDPEEIRTWEAWKADFNPEFTQGRAIETAEVTNEAV